MLDVMAPLAQAAARRFGERTAITMLESGDRASFAEIDRRAARFAGGLAAQGLGRGDRIVLHLANGIDWGVCYHAIARLGAVVVPVNILLSPAEVAFIVRDSGAAAIILPADRLAAVDFELGAIDAPLLRVAHGGDAGAGSLTAARLAADAPLVEPADVRADDLFTIGYTSGTTGRPKGAMQTHRAVSNSLAMTSTIHVRTAHDRVLSALPFAHVYGNIVLNSSFLTGLQLFAASRFDPGLCLEVIAREAITLFEGVPTMYHQMLAHPAIETVDLSSLSRCTVGGQSMPTATLEEVAARFSCPVLELWGMTEVSGPAITHSPYWPARHGSIGLPFPGTEVRIADLEDAAQDAPDGAAGELCIRGPLVTTGYWNNAQATADTIDSQGWLSTGDIAVRDADGCLTIVDRRKDLIITGGYNIYPAELEQVIARHPAVAMVAVASVPDAEKGELPKAFVVLRRHMTCDADSIARHCRQWLAPYKIPRLVAFVEDLPKTSTGKIMRRALREL